jgi:PhzF family phenazine biosynthesis protein
MNSTSLQYWIVDAFTQVPYHGNPAAVMLLSAWPADDWLHSVAREIQLSETAFLVPADRGYRLRWFTPTVEVDLCGHATLASAHVVWAAGLVPEESPVEFATRSGRLVCRRNESLIEMDFPSKPAQKCEPPAGLIEALGCEPVEVGRNAFDFIVRVEDAAVVRNLQPNLKALREIRMRGVIVTAPGDAKGIDFVSRFFAPAVGVDEDPVTGSAHCCLGPYWADILGKTRLNAYQASQRGGEVTVVCLGDRVSLCGHAVSIAAGQWLAPHLGR